MATSAFKTTDRIIDASLALFNAKGFANVPMSTIAMTVGISPGNLNYHFKSKADIVLAVYPLLQDALRQSKSAGEPFDAREGVRQLLEILRTMWRYRFFFNGLLQLLSDDRALRRRYQEMERNMVASIQAILDELIEQGDMHEIDAPNSTKILAHAWWMVWVSWLRFEQLESPRSAKPRNAALYDCIFLTVNLAQPYFVRAVVDAMLDALNAELPQSVLATARRQRLAAPKRARTARVGSSVA